MNSEKKNIAPVSLIQVDMQMLTDYYSFLKERLLNIEKAVNARPLDQWVTETELLEKFKCSKRFLYEIRTSGAIKYTKGFAGYTYRIKDVNDYLMQNYSSLTPPANTAETERWNPKQKKQKLNI